MTTQDLGRARGELGDLFEHSPADPSHTAPAAELGFLLGLLSLGAVPFSLAYGLSVMLGGLALVCAVVGLAQASRTGTAGGHLAAAGLVLALTTLILVGLRFAGVQTTFGDGLVPHLHAMLESLDRLVPQP